MTHVFQTILNDMVFFILGGVAFDQVPGLVARATTYVRENRNREGDHHHDR